MDLSAFIDAIRETPDDPLGYLNLADYLHANDDPLLAEYLRTKIALVYPNMQQPDDQRTKELANRLITCFQSHPRYFRLEEKLGVEAGRDHLEFSSRVSDFYAGGVGQLPHTESSPADPAAIDELESILGVSLPLGFRRWLLEWGNGFGGMYSVEWQLAECRRNPDIVRRAREPFPYSWKQMNHEPRHEEMPGHWTIESIEFEGYPLSTPGLLCIARTTYGQYSVVLNGECRSVVCALNWNYESDEYMAYEYLCPEFGIVPEVIDQREDRIFNHFGRSPVPASLAMATILAKLYSDLP